MEGLARLLSFPLYRIIFPFAVGIFAFVLLYDDVNKKFFPENNEQRCNSQNINLISDKDKKEIEEVISLLKNNISDEFDSLFSNLKTETEKIFGSI